MDKNPELMVHGKMISKRSDCVENESLLEIVEREGRAIIVSESCASLS